MVNTLLVVGLVGAFSVVVLVTIALAMYFEFRYLYAVIPGALMIIVPAIAAWCTRTRARRSYYEPLLDETFYKGPPK
jgi:hypothetical protein